MHRMRDVQQGHMTCTRVPKHMFSPSCAYEAQDKVVADLLWSGPCLEQALHTWEGEPKGAQASAQMHGLYHHSCRR